MPHESRQRLEALEMEVAMLRERCDALERERERLRHHGGDDFLMAILNTHPEPFFAKDEEHRWVMLNDAACKVMGRPREELLGKSDYDLFPPEQAAVFWEGDERILQNGGQETREEEITWHGKLHNISTIKCFYRDPATARRYIVGMVRDITNYKNAIQSHAESEERFRYAIEALNDALWDWHLDTDHLYISPQFYNILGYNKDDLFASLDNILAITHPDDRDRFRLDLQDIMDQHENLLPLELRMLCKDGSYKWIQVRGTVINRNEEGRPVRLLGTCQDITESKGREEALRRSQELAAMGTLAGGVAHEYNNIHTSVIGFLQLVLGNTDLGEEDRDCLQRVLRGIQRASSITRNLLSFARHNVTTKQPVSLNDMVEETLDLVRREYESEGVSINFQAGRVRPIEADANQLSQVMINLLINAYHAVKAAEKRNITITTGEDEGMAILKVVDSGCGIPREHFEKIFLPFFSTKGEHARSGSPLVNVRGTGLGLSVCHTIVAGHNGKISVESVPGKGSEFTVLLPLAREGGLGLPPEPETELKSSGRVLVIDDEEDIRHLCRLTLQKEGFEVVTEDDGNKALDMLRAEKFDLILLDLQMPAMSGLDFYQQLKELDSPPPVLIITGKVTQDIDHLVSHEQLLRKPFDSRQLLGEVNNRLLG